MNVAVVAPAATVTLEGTVAAALLDANVTVSPPAGAGPVSVSVAVEVPPPFTEVGESEIPDRVAGETIMLTDFVTVPRVAVRVAVVLAATGVVVIVKVAEDEPSGTVTVAGTTATAELDETETTIPPAGALPLRKTVPTVDAPPTTVLGATAM